MRENGWRAGRRRFRPRTAALLGLAVLLLAVGSPFWAPLLLRRLAFFRVRRVEIHGARYAAPGDILARLHVDTMASVWDPVAPLERRIATHPEVRSVHIRRQLPGTLVIEIAERSPVGLVSTPRGFKAYDERGVSLPIDPAKTAVDAPILIRPDSVVLALLGRLRQEAPTLYQRISEVRRVAADELLFVLSPAMPVRTSGSISTRRLSDVEPVERDLAHRHVRVGELDLRYRDQVIARLQ